VTPRALTVGALVRLIVSSDRMSDPLVVVGQVVWVVNGHPSRAGVSFAGAPGNGPPTSAWVRSLRDAQEAPAIEIVVAPPEVVDATPAELLPRLLERARELAGAGATGAASVLLDRAAALAPEDPEVLALRRELDRAAAAAPAA
jgi:hypothetical protein